ncbi:MAG TPA: glycosyltransferase family 39 protein [Caulobacterales bacterium]|nr:glycosyltransferase family 39 protein [Caulobacterales bacterium]
MRAALCDDVRREHTVGFLLAGYTAVWTLFDIISRWNMDIHYDMGEMVAWSRDLALGSPKHPPMGAWIAGIWFAVFPYRDWAFYLLANCLIALALWLAWRLSERRLDDNKRVVALAFLMLIPFFNLFAWKYNANTILIPLWAITTFFFFRSLETRSRAMAALTGLAAAAAMMGKYWSIFLLAGLGFAALVSPHRRAYFRSASPWITIVVGTLSIAPHLYWVWTHQFLSIDYAMKGHAAKTFPDALKDAVLYLMGLLAYIAFPLVLIALVARPKLVAWLDAIWPRNRARCFVAVAFWAPILLPIPVALLNDTRLASIWTMSAVMLAPIVFLSSPKIRISPVAARKILAAAFVFSFSALAIAPARALRTHEANVRNLGADYKPIAHAVQKAWRQTSGAPLAIVGSYGNLANGIAFYLRDRPSVLNVEAAWQTPSVDGRRIEQQGIAIVCPLEHLSCVRAAEQIARGRPEARYLERPIARHYRGAASGAKHYLIITIPPART